MSDDAALARRPVLARLVKETRRALDRHAAERAAVEERREEPPEPGDVFVLERTAEFDVEWAIIARDPADSRRLLTVPADGCSFVGATDVEVSERAQFGPLVLRCRFGSWLDAALFGPGARVGVLDPEDVARAFRQWSVIEAGAGDGSGVEHEVDEDPDYQDWVDDVLLPARLALTRPPT